MPRPRNRKEVREETEQQYVGWQWEGSDSLPVVLQRLNMVLGILKAALVQPLDPEGNDPLFGNFVIGDYMRQERQGEQQQDDAWNDYLNTRQNPPGWAEVQNAPTPRIQDITRERNSADSESRRRENS